MCSAVQLYIMLWEKTVLYIVWQQFSYAVYSHRPGPVALLYKVEMNVTLALVRQILLWIEELQTFNMVSGIDLRHLAL